MPKLTKEEAARPGSRLLNLLFAKADSDGLLQRELAAVLGVTYGYLHQLRTGLRETRHTSDDFLTACAKFLNMPRIAVMAAAGQLSLADFYEPQTLAASVDAAWALLGRAPQVAPFMSAELDDVSLNAKLFILRLYERAEGVKLLPELVEVTTLKQWLEPTADNPVPTPDS
jgi:transcriptional regulator with XRE-family HTH domain